MLKFDYKRYIKLTLLVVIFSIAKLENSNASECYRYHTSTSYKIVLVKEKPYLQITVLDPNGISIQQQQRIPMLQVCNKVRIVDQIPMDVSAVAQPSSLEITAFGCYFDGTSFWDTLFF